MIYDFLKDFHRRAEIIAIVDFLTGRIARKATLREYDLDGGEAVNIVMLVLCFIMEKSLVEESCTKNDVASFVRRIDIEYLKKNIPDEEYYNMTDFIIKDCLQNSGVPHYFVTYNFEENREEKISVKLIDDKRISIGTENAYSYYMTPQGYKFMFNTLEIEDTLQVSIEQFKLSLSIKKRNFNAARNNADSLFNISKTQIQRINYFIKKIKEDIAGTGIEEYESIYAGTFSSIDEQKSGYDNLYELINKAENSIMDGTGAEIGDSLKKELENLFYVKTKLKFIINEQSNLLLKQQELQKIYNEAVDNILFIGFENRFNFEETVTKKLEANPAIAYNLIRILRPLFKPDPVKFFNLKKAVKEQKMIFQETVSESNILMSDRYFTGFETENEIKIRSINEKYTDIFETICIYALNTTGREILLSEIFDNLYNTDNGGDNYYTLVPSLKSLTNVLLQLTSVKNIDFSAIKSQQNKTVFNPSEAFDIKYCVIKLLNRNIKYGSIKSMDVMISRSKTVFIPEKRAAPNTKGEQTPPDGFLYENTRGLTCPDILFKIETGGQ